MNKLDLDYIEQQLLQEETKESKLKKEESDLEKAEEGEKQDQKKNKPKRVYQRVPSKIVSQVHEPEQGYQKQMIDLLSSLNQKLDESLSLKKQKRGGALPKKEDDQSIQEVKQIVKNQEEILKKTHDLVQQNKQMDLKKFLYGMYTK